MARAASDVRVLVVGNPANTNCLIAMSHGVKDGIPAERFHAMTRLDQNRAMTQLARKAAAPVTSVTNMAIWGNHSATQYPDAENARIDGKPAMDVIDDQNWIQGEFIEIVQQRGAAVIGARGLSSAASAANAALDHVVSVQSPTPQGDWVLHGITFGWQLRNRPRNPFFPTRSRATATGAAGSSRIFP